MLVCFFPSLFLQCIPARIRPTYLPCQQEHTCSIVIPQISASYCRSPSACLSVRTRSLHFDPLYTFPTTEAYNIRIAILLVRKKYTHTNTRSPLYRVYIYIYVYIHSSVYDVLFDSQIFFGSALCLTGLLLFYEHTPGRRNSELKTLSYTWKNLNVRVRECVL